jgi:hypothetical protein
VLERASSSGLARSRGPNSTRGAGDSGRPRAAGCSRFACARGTGQAIAYAPCVIVLELVRHPALRAASGRAIVDTHVVGEAAIGAVTREALEGDNSDQGVVSRRAGIAIGAVHAIGRSRRQPAGPGRARGTGELAESEQVETLRASADNEHCATRVWCALQRRVDRLDERRPDGPRRASAQRSRGSSTRNWVRVSLLFADTVPP